MVRYVVSRREMPPGSRWLVHEAGSRNIVAGYETYAEARSKAKNLNSKEVA